jgi:pseudouridine kinase
VNSRRPEQTLPGDMKTSTVGRPPSTNPVRRLVVVGALMVDRLGRAQSNYFPGTSNPGTVVSRTGGVGGNIARAAHRLGVSVRLVSRVGADAAGDAAIGQLQAVGMAVDSISRSGRFPTATYLALHDHRGELVGAVNDMQILGEITLETASQALVNRQAEDFVLTDCNIRKSVIEALARTPVRPRFLLEAVSQAKVVKCRDILDRIDLLFANVAEIEALAGATFATAGEACAWLRNRGTGSSVISHGRRGVTVDDGHRCRAFGQIAATPVDVTGAGDALVAGTLYGLCHGIALMEAVHYGRAAAALTVESVGAAPEDLTLARLTGKLREADSPS